MYKGLDIDQKILSNFNLYKYQEDICISIVKKILESQYSYNENNEHNKNIRPENRNRNMKDIIILKSITGSGKTIMLIKILDILMELVRNNRINNMNILWASNSSELNKQSMSKFWNASQSDSFSSYFDDLNIFEVTDKSSKLENNTIGFINNHKLGERTNLRKESENNGYENFFNKLSKLKEENLKILVIDECHNGVNKGGILDQIKDNYKPDIIIATSATPQRFIESLITKEDKIKSQLPYTVFETKLEDVKSEGIIKDNIVLLKDSIEDQEYSSTLTKIVVEDYLNIKNMWDKYISKNEIALNENSNIQKPPVILIQVEDKFEEKINDLTKLVMDLTKFSGNKISTENIFHSLMSKKQPIELLTPEKPLIKYINASKIDNNEKLKVIIFKQNLQEGWDCPRAEILYSIRPVKNGKDIAQILGRVLRNPFKKNIEDDELKELMSVYFYAPYYDNNLLSNIAAEINDEIKIKQHSSQIKRKTYFLEIDDYFLNKVNDLKLPIFDKNEVKSPYVLLNNLLSKEKGTKKVKQKICKKIIDSVSYSITKENVKETTSDSLNKTKVKLEDFFNENYKLSVEKLNARKKVLDDIDFKYKKTIRGISLLDNSSPENSPLFNEVEDLYENDELINEFNVIKKIYPDATTVQLVKIFWLTAIEHNSIKRIMNDIFKEEINLLRKDSNLVVNDKKMESSILTLKKNIEKEFNEKNVLEYPKLNSALSYSKNKNKTIINKDSELEEKIIDYLNTHLTSWIRNYTDSDSLKIIYNFEDEVHAFHPDFIGFDQEDNFTIIETKAKAFEDHILKLKGTLEYCQKNKCALIWIIQHKKSYKKLNIGKVSNNIDKLTIENLLEYCDDLPL